jgi:steroid delta-isomerase-like uncharacterized protein
METGSQSAKDVVRRFFGAWNESDFASIDEVVAADAEHHDPMDPPDLPSGPEGERQLIEAYRSAFPDARIEIEDMVAEDDRVAVRWTATGTHEWEFRGVEATGTEVEVVGFEINRLADGQIAESWVLFDALGMMQQLGGVPEEQ